MKKKNKVKPTLKQRKAFENIEKAMSMRQAMIQAGYSEKSAKAPKQNLLETRGYQTLQEKFNNHLTRNGVTPEMLAEIQTEGLFDQNGAIRLMYVKETKKDLGIGQTSNPEGVSKRITFEEFFKDE